MTNRVIGNTTRVTQGSGGGSAITRNTPGPGGGGVARTGSGDVYAGRDGNVYRKQGDSWQKYDNGSWGSVPTPSPQDRAGDRNSGASAGTTDRSRSSSSSDTMGQLERDRAARTEGATRTRDYGTTRSGGSRSGSYGGSYRAGGGMRGGGRRR